MTLLLKFHHIRARLNGDSVSDSVGEIDDLAGLKASLVNCSFSLFPYFSELSEAMHTTGNGRSAIEARNKGIGTQHGALRGKIPSSISVLFKVLLIPPN